MENGIPVITVTEDKIEIRKIPGANINAEDLNNTLLTLPAKTYLELYHKMHVKIYGYPPLSVYGNCSGVCGEPQENKESSL